MLSRKFQVPYFILFFFVLSLNVVYAQSDLDSICSQIGTQDWEDSLVIPLFSWYSPSLGDNFATTKKISQGCRQESISWDSSSDYRFVRLEAIIFSPDKPQPEGTIPLYRWYELPHGDNWTTSQHSGKGSIGEPLSQSHSSPYFEGYVYPPSYGFREGLVPIYSWYSPGRVDNWITSQHANVGSRGEGLTPDYRFVRLEGYGLSLDFLSHTLQEIPDQTEGPSSIITAVSSTNERPCLGESILVSVETDNSLEFDPLKGTGVYIQGHWGNERYLQFTGIPGPRRITITSSDGKGMEVRTLEIEVVECERVYPIVLVHSSPADPYNLHFVISNLEQIGAVPEEISWHFGTSEGVFKGETPFSYNYGGFLNHNLYANKFTVSINVSLLDGENIEVKKTVDILNGYVLNKQRQLLQPYVKADTVIQGGLSKGVFLINNPEPEDISFESSQREDVPCDSNTLSEFFPVEPLFSFLDAESEFKGVVDLPFNVIGMPVTVSGSQLGQGGFISPLDQGITRNYPPSQELPNLPSQDNFYPVRTTSSPNGLCGINFHLLGQSESGRKAVISLHFRADENPFTSRVIGSKEVNNLLNKLVEEGKVRNPNVITGEELYELELEGEFDRHNIYYPSKTNLVATKPFDVSAPQIISRIIASLGVISPLPDLGKTISIIDGETILMMNHSPSLGSECNPSEVPPKEGISCQFTDEWKEAPAYIANAKKGDIILSAGCGLIGSLLREVNPAQFYSHTGIMTQSYYEVRHSTASEERYGDYREGTLGGKGVNPNVLKYGWPGVITQSVWDAYNGGFLEDPRGKSYEISAFNRSSVRCSLDENIVTPLVVKPPLEWEVETRPRLHEVSENAESYRGHYRFFGYTDGTVSLSNLHNAPPEGGWANGTRGSVCSTFIWAAAKELGITLEGTLESETSALPEIEAFAEVDGATGDGLYLYREEERLAAGESIYNGIYNDVFEENWLGWFIDAPDNYANQTTNCFASDYCSLDASNSEAWRDSPGLGRTVSPQDIFYWDPPPTGVYGYSEPLLYRSERFYRVYRWQTSEGYYNLSGRVIKDGVGVQAEVSFAGEEQVTNSDGSFIFNAVPGGNYEAKAKVVLDDREHYAGVPVELDSNINDLILNLQPEASFVPNPQIVVVPPPPSNTYRRVVIDGEMSLLDDELIRRNERGSFPLLAEFDLNPNNRTGSKSFSECVGGEVRGEIDFHVRLRDDDMSVEVTVNSYLFEGTSCGTREQEDSESLSLVVSPSNDSVERTIKLVNRESFGGDTATFQFTVRNQIQP